MKSTKRQSSREKQTGSAPSSSYRWAVVGMLWFICFFNYADRVAISSVFPVLEKQYHFTKPQLGLIGAVFTWVYALAAPFAGQVGDKGTRKLVILGGLYIWSLVTGLTSLCTKVWQFVLVRGIGHAFTSSDGEMAFVLDLLRAEGCEA